MAGILTNICPRAITTGDTLNYKRNRAISFGQYCQIHEEETPHNSTKLRIRGAICMGPRGKNKGEFKFITLGLMKKLVRGSWYTIPMPDTVIVQVHILDQGQHDDIDFLDHKNNTIGELKITGVDTGETEAQHIDLIEPETDLYTISTGTETLPELVQRQTYPPLKKNKIWVLKRRAEP